MGPKIIGNIINWYNTYDFLYDIIKNYASILYHLIQFYEIIIILIICRNIHVQQKQLDGWTVRRVDPTYCFMFLAIAAIVVSKCCSQEV